MAEWLWYDDKKWVKYDAAVCRKLEEGYWRGDSKVGTDAERFVEIVRPQADVMRVLRENFKRLPPRTPDMVGMQRRCDDESRRRIVRRRPLHPLTGVRVCLLPPAVLATEALAARLLEYGAILMKLPPHGTLPLPGTVAVALDPAASDIVRARSMCDAVVTADWLTKVFEDGPGVPTAPYLVKSASAASAAAAVPESAEDAPGKKRPREEGEEEGQQEEGKEEKKEKQEEPFETTRPLLYAGTVLTGTVTYADGQRVGVVVRVATVAHRGALCDAYEGEMTWVDLHGACTRVRGTLATAPGARAAWETVLRLEEYAVVRGADEVDVPAHYALRLADDGRTLAGHTCAAATTTSTTAVEDSADIVLTADRPLLPVWAVGAGDADAGAATCVRFAVAPGQAGVVVPAHARLAPTVAAGAALAGAWQLTVVRARQTGSRTQTFAAEARIGGSGTAVHAVAGTLAGPHLRLALDDGTLVFDGEWVAGAGVHAGVLRRCSPAGGAEEPCTVRFWHRLPARFAVARAPDPLAPLRGRTLRGRVLVPDTVADAPPVVAARGPKHIVVRSAFAEPAPATPLPGTVARIDVPSAKELDVCYAEFLLV